MSFESHDHRAGFSLRAADMRTGAKEERRRTVALLRAGIDSRVLEPEATDALEDMLRQIEAGEP